MVMRVFMIMLISKNSNFLFVYCLLPLAEP